MKLGSAEGAEAVLAYVKDPDPVVAVQAARALEAAMPERLTGAVAQLVVDSRLDPEVRCALIGALQLRASGEEANKAVLDVLASGAPSNVRDRASYAATRLVDKSDIGTIVKLVEQERQEYVLIRLAYTLNKLTGAQVALDQKKPLAKSSPGRRKDFVEQWIAAK
ncbi:MAG: HEAT repeat domain-containing protein [Candidatus Hydrogenedentes bacterium]|nr:HEAT repeat domain-containing protein [Candidatus Hydrogenedentota bacterium]